MDESVHRLTIQFLSWLEGRPRTYGEAMDAWRTTCPRLTVWEDAIKDGLIQVQGAKPMKQSTISLTSRGRQLLQSNSS